jgi:hypothetical protein
MEFSATLAANPETRAVFMKYNRTMDNRQAKQLEDATAFFFRLLDHSRKIATGEYSPGPFERLAKQPAPQANPLILSPAPAAAEGSNDGLNGGPTPMMDQQSTGKAPKTRRPSTRKQHRESEKLPLNQPSDTTAPNNQTPGTNHPPKTSD